MSEQTPDQERTGYDPSQDPDADPDMLEPRTQGEASGTTEGDPDADPEMLNPRDGDEASGSAGL